jgi:hypothetical protein
MGASTAYNQDFHAWLLHNAALLRVRNDGQGALRERFRVDSGEVKLSTFHFQFSPDEKIYGAKAWLKHGHIIS